jgi:hypothetical protein
MRRAGTARLVTLGASHTNIRASRSAHGGQCPLYVGAARSRAISALAQQRDFEFVERMRQLRHSDACFSS